MKRQANRFPISIWICFCIDICYMVISRHKMHILSGKFVLKLTLMFESVKVISLSFVLSAETYIASGFNETLSLLNENVNH